MPTEGDGQQAVVDVAGLLPLPDRDYRSHTFVGVDYDLNVDSYGSQEAFDKVLADRLALIQSAVTLKVDNVDGDTVQGNQFQTDVTVSNNLLGHNAPPVSPARQFWLSRSRAQTADGTEVCSAGRRRPRPPERVRVRLDRRRPMTCPSATPRCAQVFGATGKWRTPSWLAFATAEDCVTRGSLQTSQKILDRRATPTATACSRRCWYQSFPGGIEGPLPGSLTTCRCGQ